MTAKQAFWDIMIFLIGMAVVMGNGSGETMSKEVERSEESYRIEFTDSQILKLEQAGPDG